MKKYFLLPLLFIIIYSCGKSTTMLLKAGGKEGELLIVIDNKYWENAVGDSLTAFFEGIYPGLPQIEPLFKVYQIPPQKFNSTFKHTNNILLINIDEKLTGQESKLTYAENNWALGQVVLQLSCGNEVEFFKAFREKRNRMLDIIRSKDVERIQARFSTTQSTQLLTDLRKALNIELIIPEGYAVNVQDTNFFYALHEALKKADGMDNQVSRGVWAASFPVTTPDFYNVKYLSHLRDSITLKHIQGSTDSTYMIIEDWYEPDSSAVNLNGEYCMEMRGLWKMNNKFMGGPFVNYTYFDKANRRIIMVDGFVFAPRFDKRDYILELEAICRSLKVL